MEKVNAMDDVEFGCVCIAERHTLESAAARGKAYPTEHENMVRKQRAGCRWFISQAIYDPTHTIRLLKDYAALCREEGLVPRKVVLTFTPVSRPKTMNFVKWLGVSVPVEAEERILSAGKDEGDHAGRVDASVTFLCEVLATILEETAGCGVPLGISCESVSIFKSEIDGVHTLFRKLQKSLLDTRGTPWKVQWFYLPDSFLATAAHANMQPPELQISAAGSSLKPSSEKRLQKEDFMRLVKKGTYSLEELVTGDWWNSIQSELEEELMKQKRLSKTTKLSQAYDNLLQKREDGSLTEQEEATLNTMESLIE